MHDEAKCLHTLIQWIDLPGASTSNFKNGSASVPCLLFTRLVAGDVIFFKIYEFLIAVYIKTVSSRV